jgi:multiple antibiotic resistance protein
VTSSDFLSVVASTFVALFPVVNPIGDAPIFLGMTKPYPASTRRMLAAKISIYGFGLLAGSLLLGSEILAFFGITLMVVQIAGGLVVAVTGWRLLNDAEPDPGRGTELGTLDDAMSHAFFPLTLPITVGPGCISIAITIGAHLRRQAGPGFEHGYPRHFLAALLGMALVCVLVAFCYGEAGRIVQILGRSGTTIAVRLSAFILMAIGVQIIWNGLHAGLPELLRSGRENGGVQLNRYAIRCHSSRPAGSGLDGSCSES